MGRIVEPALAKISIAIEVVCWVHGLIILSIFVYAWKFTQYNINKRSLIYIALKQCLSTLAALGMA